MRWKLALLMVGSLAFSTGQSASKAVIVNSGTAPWTADKDGSPSSESALLREDPQTGGMELFVRFAPGRAIAPHWHDSNERILLLEGELTLRSDGGASVVKPGGFAFLPAHEVQRLTCSSKERCTAYLSWDGKPNSHPAK